MRGTKEDVAKTIRYVANGMCTIADKIENGTYDPEDWRELAGKFANVFACLKIQGHEFMNNNDAYAKDNV